jgi:flagellar basal-body rod modification protein FlgD
MSTTITGTTTPTYVSDALKKTSGLSSDDFMKLFLAELQYQDPLAPQDASAMLTQLSQLTQVEQAYNTADTLSKLLASQDNNLAMSSVSLIGKNVTALGNQVGLDGSNPVAINYQMPAATDSTVLKITDASGQVVRTVDLGSQLVGDNSYQWDGTNGQGNLLPAGAYTFSIIGTNALGTEQEAITFTTGRADGVTFYNGVAYVNIGAVSVPFADVGIVKES